jgi:diaminopimelate decarboxylase
LVKERLRSSDRRYFRSRWKLFLKQDRNGELYFHDYSIRELAKKFGTPFYVYSEDEIRHKMRRMKSVFSGYRNVKFQYPCKINSNLEILKIAREEGFDIDVSSPGEIILGLLADFEPQDISFTNLYKSDQDIYFAAKLGVRYITTDYIEEIEKINQVGKSLGKVIDIMIRVNPLIQLGSYSTLWHKYGIPLNQVTEAIDIATSSEFVNLKGFHFHGAYVHNYRVFFEAAKKILPMAEYAKNMGNKIEIIDLGGGFPRETMAKTIFQPEDMGEEFIRFFKRLLKKHKLEEDEPMLVFEPGKFLLSASGVGVMNVISTKALPNNLYCAVTDGSTYGFVPDLLIDPKLQYDILPANKMDMPRLYDYEVAGLTCDSWDVVAKKRKLPKLEAGDLLMIMDIGAYSHVIASNFNNIKRAPMILINKDGKQKLIRRRDRYSEMFAPELDVLKVADPNELKKYYDLSRVNMQKLWAGGLKEDNNGNGSNGAE